MEGGTVTALLPASFFFSSFFSFLCDTICSQRSQNWWGTSPFSSAFYFKEWSEYQLESVWGLGFVTRQTQQMGLSVLRSARFLEWQNSFTDSFGNDVLRPHCMLLHQCCPVRNLTHSHNDVSDTPCSAQAVTTLLHNHATLRSVGV